jgi:endonuclease/exonuclease/phosphatase family metal-dependent hydrolase
LNTRTLRTQERLAELEQALQKIKWDILGLSEVRRLGEEIQEYQDFILYYRGETKGLHGVGFMVKKHLKDYIIQFTSKSERIAVLDIKLPNQKQLWSIVQIYAPTEQANDEEKTKFYTSLRDVMETTQKNKIVMGDFNSQIGKQNEGESNIMGPHSVGKRNENGRLLIDFALEYNLKIMNTYFKKKLDRTWTWISPDGKYKNAIDFITTNRPSHFKDVSILNQVNFNTNHRMVRAAINIEGQKSRTHIKNPVAHIPIPIPKEICSEIKKKLELIKGSDPIQKKYNTLENILTNIAKKLNATKHKKDSLGQNARELIAQRKDMLVNRKENTKQIEEISKAINKSIKEHRKNARLNKIQAEIEQTGGIKKVLKTLRDHKTWIPNMRNNNNIATSKRPLISQIATEFYRKLYKSDEKEDKDEDINEIKEELVPCIMESEVRKAILTQKNGKAPGPDRITNEILKGTLEIIGGSLTTLFNEILSTVIIPEQWTKTTITLIHKKGDKSKIDNYRPISLMTNLYKVFSKIILNRLTKKLDEQQPREQAGFRTDFSTVDHMHVVKQIVEKYNEYGKPYYMSFVDYNKAFDSLSHSYIYGSLKKQGIESKYIKILKKIYDHSKARIQLETVGEEFRLERGVRQGDPLSPKLFSAVLEEIFRNLEFENKGLNINGTNLSHLRRGRPSTVFRKPNPTTRNVRTGSN